MYCGVRAGSVVDVWRRLCGRHHRVAAVLGPVASLMRSGTGWSSVAPMVLNISMKSWGMCPWLFTTELRCCLTSGTSQTELLQLFDSLMEYGPLNGVVSNVWCFVFRHLVV